MDYLKALILGIIEGLTEFVPVSSTGHLLLSEHFFNLGDDDFGKTFAVLIQLGAILALLTVYFGKLWRVMLAIRRDPAARNFVLAVLIAFLPAALLGVLAHGFIKSVLFNPFVVCLTLIAGGLVLLVVDETDFDVRHDDAMTFSLPMALKIGLFQCLAMVPGVSRSGATIVGAMVLGSSKRAAAEFSFFLSMPTMGGAFAYDLLKNYKTLSSDGIVLIAIGFAAAFVMGLIVVRFLLDYVSRRGFALFAWWRLTVGAAGLAGLAIFG